MCSKRNRLRRAASAEDVRAQLLSASGGIPVRPCTVCANRDHQKCFMNVHDGRAPERGFCDRHFRVDEVLLASTIKDLEATR